MPDNSEPRLIRLLEDVASTLRDVLKYDRINVVIDHEDIEYPFSFQNNANDKAGPPYILISGITQIEIPIYKQQIRNFLSTSVNLVTRESEIEIHWRPFFTVDREGEETDDYETDINNDGLFPYVELPEWLDHLVFEELGGVYQPDPISHSHNLENTEEKNLVYLGTYFPRSYAESFLLFRDIFLNRGFNDFYGNVHTLRLIDIGSGTAGEIIGFIHAIASAFESPPKLDIVIIDGNKRALDLAQNIITQTCSLLDIQVDLHIHHYVIKKPSDLVSLKAPITQLYDFVITSKFINELISAYPKQNTNLYYDFTKNFRESLSSNGMICLIDVTTQSNGSLYFPNLLNFQINQIEKNDPLLRTVIPLSCHSFGKECDESCFFGRVINLAHSRCGTDTTKITCRVVGISDFVSPCLLTATKANYYSPWINYRHQQTELVCKKGLNHVQKMDAFKI